VRDDLLLGLRVVVSLLVVVAILWFGGRRLGAAHTGGGSDLRVVGRVALSRRSSAALVEVDGRRLLVGVGDAGVTLISDLTPAPADITAAGGAPPQVPVRVEASPSSLTTVPAPAPRAVTGPDWQPRPGAGSRPRGDDAHGPLDGSVLSPATWKQTWNAVTGAAASPSGRHRA